MEPVSGPATLEQLQEYDQNFPHDILIGHKTALVVFAAGFHGRQDAVWVKAAGLRATCVDTDADKLTEMEAMYPPDWEWVPMDAFEFAALSRRKWDVVTLDPWTNQFTDCADALPTWCRLARHAVIIGTGRDTLLDVPDGWETSGRRQRSDYDGGVYWSILERE